VTTTENPPSKAAEADSSLAQPVSRLADRVFGGLSFGAATLILVALAAVAIFLITEGLPTFTADEGEFDRSFLAYVGPLVFGTAYAAAIGLLLATPVAVAVALYISHYAPRRLAKTLGYFVDLLAAVLAPILSDSLYPWLEDNAAFLPFFGPTASTSGRTMMTAGIVLAVMVLPIITAISREVFLQTPRLHEEASLALGATRWEMIRQAVLPFGRSGVISGAMLGLGRALGETMAVAIILAPANGYFWNVITNQNSNTIASNIALSFPESSGLEVNRLIATGLVLFAITFGVNATARKISSAGFSGAD
jgi:phosphate transport system permease protein